MSKASRPTWLPWAVGGLIAVLVVVVVGPFVWIHFIEGKAPRKLSLTDSGSTSSAGSGSSSAVQPVAPVVLDGNWKITGTPQAGYRVKETLFGQSNTAVGRTSKVTGTMALSGSQVSAATITVDMASVTSDSGQRDNQFRNRIMDVSQFPTATFDLTEPITLVKVPTDTTPISARATGKLTLHGTTHQVTVDLTAQRSGSTIRVSGSIPVVFSDYNVDNPSGGPAQTSDRGTIEFLVTFTKA